MCMWARACDLYAKVYKEVEPKRQRCVYHIFYYLAAFDVFLATLFFYKSKSFSFVLLFISVKDSLKLKQS